LKKNKVTAIVLAAGSGSRIGGSVKKQFIQINNKPILQYTLEKFQTSGEIDEIIIVLPKDYVSHFADIILKKWGIKKLTDIVAGGEERQDSVFSALQTITNNTEIVLVHDGVRPFIKQNEIKKLIKSARKNGSAVIGIQPKDTIKNIENNLILGTYDRSKLLAVQTPQVFQRDIILNAYKNGLQSKQHFTDDASLVEYSGGTVHVVQGGYHNIKITTPEDLWLAEHMLTKGIVE
jgi:2-C-methyl-D-erythritol 4-phosphate cytidylyltransferase